MLFDENVQYRHFKDGFYYRYENDIYSAYRKADKPLYANAEAEPHLIWKAPKIDASLLERALAFCKRVFEEYGTEAAVLLTYNRFKKEDPWGIYVPKQKVSPCFLSYHNDTDHVIGTIHSHPTFSNKPSSVDIESRNYKMPGLHLIHSFVDGLNSYVQTVDFTSPLDCGMFCTAKELSDKRIQSPSKQDREWIDAQFSKVTTDPEAWSEKETDIKPKEDRDKEPDEKELKNNLAYEFVAFSAANSLAYRLYNYAPEVSADLMPLIIEAMESTGAFEALEALIAREFLEGTPEWEKHIQFDEGRAKALFEDFKEIRKEKLCLTDT